MIPNQELLLKEPTESAPENFEFVGNLESQERKKMEEERQKKRKRSPSPRETFFEMNHPMGYWNMGRW